MGKKKQDFLDWQNWWAQSVFRTQIANKGKICALIRKRYPDKDNPDVPSMDVETFGPSQWIGIEEYEDVQKIRDNDPESETYGERIPDPNGEGKKKMRFIWDDTKETREKIRKLCGTTNYGSTILSYKFREGTIDAPDYEEYWTKPIMEAYKELVLNQGKTIVAVPLVKKDGKN